MYLATAVTRDKRNISVKHIHPRTKFSEIEGIGSLDYDQILDL